MGLNEEQRKERSEYLEKYLNITECSQRKPYVFVSYASDNWETVFKTAVVPMQRKYGLRVYADKAFDKVNDKWIVPMLRNIRGADAVVVFVSQSYIESYACFLELLTAVNNRKPVVFVSLEDSLRLGDTTDQPIIERGAKNEILNQGANISTNTNNTSNDTMRAMKSAYTSISTLLEQDALSKYDISDAFINFFRDASINRKTIHDLRAVRGTIASVSQRVFDKSLIQQEDAAPQPAPRAAAPEPPVEAQPAPPAEEPQSAADPAYAAVQTAEPEPAAAPEPAAEPAAESAGVAVEERPEPRTEPEKREEAAFSWKEQKQEPAPKASGGKPKLLALIGVGAAAVLLVLFLVLRGGTTNVTDQPYTMTDSSSEAFEGTYTGEWSRGKKQPSGSGTFVLADNAGTYVGEWVDGVAQGKGTITWTSGGTYEGDWLGGVRTGQGTMRYANEQVYEGEWLDNQRSGQGRCTWPDGGFIDGEWKNDQPNGQVVNYIGGGEDDDVSHYEGEMVDGVFEGYGIYYWTDGSSYEGQWKGGSYNGQGKLTYSDGVTVEGVFVDGHKDGDMVCTLADGTRIDEKWDHGAKYVTDTEYTTPSGEKGLYTGYWNVSENYPQGKGTFVDENNRRYEGDWVEGRREGSGRLTWSSGGYYEGEWTDDKRTGQGTEYYVDDGESLSEADCYVGAFVDGYRHGQGVYTWASGQKYEGGYEKGKRHGHGIYSYPNGNKREGEWINGVLDGAYTFTYADGTVVYETWDNDTLVETRDKDGNLVER